MNKNDSNSTNISTVAPVSDEDKTREKNREKRKEKIRKGAAEMAELYRTDPELKELNEFVGDYHE
ncbi:MAG: hypothetical protein NT103_02640 [Campylobacterales bacterium]|nr:hypothetical protein [Campylobacterales bacterium]